MSSLVTTTCARQRDVDGSIILSDSKRCTSPFTNILSLELNFLDLVVIGLQSCERLQNKSGGSILRTDNPHISIGGLLLLNLNLTLSCCFEI